MSGPTKRYRGKLLGWTKEHLAITVELVVRPPMQNGFTLLPRSGVIERTFAWLNRNRHFARDWESASWSVCAFIHLAASNLLSRRMMCNQSLYQAPQHFQNTLSVTAGRRLLAPKPAACFKSRLGFGTRLFRRNW